MPLTQVLDTARSSLSVLSERTAVVSRNVANAGNDYATRKIVHTVTADVGGGVRLASIERASDQALFENAVSANSSVSRYQAVNDSLDELNNTVNDVEQDSSPAALIGKLSDALQSFETGPQDVILAQSAVQAATDTVNGLNSATQVVQQVRTRADQQIAQSVNNLNSLLSQFQQVNNDVVNNTLAGNDVTDLLDKRDKLLSDISGEIGIRTITRANNDVAIYTDSGVTLFDNQPRTVSFSPTLALTPTDTGSAVFIDGVSVTGSTAALPISSGRIKGLADVRDTIAVTYQNQLDEIARGLITTFAEKDQSATPTLPDATGLFTYSSGSGAPAIPAAGTIVPGLAGQIKVNPAVDPAQGGDPFLLRDGGINGTAYVYNSSGASGFSDRIRALNDGLNTPQTFDAAAQADTTATVMDYSSSSVGWLQNTRQSASTQLEFTKTVHERSVDSLSKETGVNLDYEMTLLLDLERSYQATSKLISSVDTMFSSLLQAVG